MKKICVTGASGFIGKSLCKTLNLSGRSMRGFVRKLDTHNNLSKVEYVKVGDINSKINWKDYLRGYDCIIHCAGKAHNMNDNKNQDTYDLINTEGTKHLAEHAVEAGVKRLVFLSSIKVNGESTGKIVGREVFKNTDTPDPGDAYAISKLKAEKALWEISAERGLEVVILRLPLVYGKEVKGNLQKLIKFVKLGIPLPLSIIKNQRSMIGIDNLVDILINCTNHPDAPGNTFLVSDDKDLSTSDLIRLIATSIGKNARLFPAPLFLLKFFGYIFGKKKEIDRLVGSLRVDNSFAKKTLQWTPTISVEEGIRKMVQGK